MTSIWQRNYYEHILRDRSELERTAKYIASNPLKWDDDEENKPTHPAGRKILPLMFDNPDKDSDP